MKKMITPIFLLAFVCTVTAQKQTTETVYDFTFSSKFKSPVQDAIGLDSMVRVVGILKSWSDHRFNVVAFQDIEVSNPLIPGISKLEEETDTLLFDLQTLLVYNLKEKTAYRYQKRSYSFEETKKDTVFLQKKDTSIILYKKMPTTSFPIATMGAFPYGVIRYANKTYSFQWKATKKSTLSLESIFDRCRLYPLSESAFNFLY